MSEKKIRSPEDRLPGLDGIRGIAILGVMLYHLMPHVFPGGFLGVNLFLVLSGFLINRSLEKEYYINKKINFFKFIIRRLKKIFVPLFWMVVMVSAFLFIFQKQLLTNYLGEALSGILFYNNWWQISNGSSYFMKFITPSTLTHLWYLSVQVQFYLIWAVLFVIIKYFSKKVKSNKAPSMYLIITMISAILMGVMFKPGQDPTRIYYGVDTRIFSFSLGALISLYVRDWKRALRKKPMAKYPEYMAKENSRSKRNRVNMNDDVQDYDKRRLPNRRRKAKLKPFGIISLIIVIIMMAFTLDNSSFTFRGGMFLYSLFSAVLIFATVNPKMMVSHILDSEIILNWLGKRSYSLYLWHYPIIVIYQVMTKGKQISGVVSLVVQLGMILLMTVISYMLFERNNPIVPIYQFEAPDKEIVKFKLTWLDKKKKRMISRVSFVSLSIMLLLSGYALGTYKGDNRVALELQKKIEENQNALLDKDNNTNKKEEETSDIEGLTTDETKYARDLDVTFIGDSILLMAVNSISEIFPKAEVDGAVGRQLYQSGPVVEQLKAESRLKDTIVIVLGANGSFTELQFNSFIKSLGANKKIFLVTTNAQTEWKDSVNTSFAENSKKHKNIHLVDWNNYMQGHSDWLEPDGTHPNAIGSAEMIKLVVKEIYKNK